LFEPQEYTLPAVSSARTWDLPVAIETIGDYSSFLLEDAYSFFLLKKSISSA
jgi:hypothetical protein